MKKTSISLPVVLAILICVFALSLMGFSILASKASAAPQASEHEYTLVYGETILDLSADVSAKLNKGWKAEGGVAIVVPTQGSLSRYYYQAMSR